MKRTPEEWMTEIDNALHFRKEFGREDKWDNLEKSYMHDPEGDTAIGPNLIYSYGDTLTSDLMVPDPEVLVAAENRFGVDKAPILERLDRQLMRKMRIKRAVDVGLIHSYLYGVFILKLGYDSLYGFDPYWDIGSAEQPLGITMTQFDKMGRRLEFGRVKPGWPWVEPVLPHDFVVPWGTTDIEKAPWCAFRFFRHVNHLKKDPKYKNTSRLVGDLNMEEIMREYEHVGARRQDTRSRSQFLENCQPNFVECWEIRDAEEHKVIVICRNYLDRPIRNDFDAIQIALNGLPVVTGSFVKHPRSFWTTPLAYYLGQLQAEQHDISLQAAKSRRLNVLKYLVRAGLMDEAQKARIMSGDVGAYEEVAASSGISLREAITIFPQGQLLDYFMHSEANRRDARDMVGYSRNQMGEFDASSRRTAREATFVREGAGKRTTKRMQMVGEAYIEVTDKANRLVFTFWTVPRDVMMEDKWVSVTGRDLKSDYAYDLSLSTKRNLSRAERKIEAFQVMMQLAQFPGANLAALYQYLMDAANDPSFERLLPAPEGGRAMSSGTALPTIPATGG